MPCLFSSWSYAWNVFVLHSHPGLLRRGLPSLKDWFQCCILQETPSDHPKFGLSFPLTLLQSSVRALNKLGRSSLFTGLLSVLPAGLWAPWGPIMQIWSISETPEFRHCFSEWALEWNITLPLILCFLSCYLSPSPPFISFFSPVVISWVLH